MNAGTLEMVDLEQMLEGSLTCNARKDKGCSNEPDWRTICPGCAVQFLWCSPCREMWEREFLVKRVFDAKCIAICPKCFHKYKAAPEFLPM